VRRDTEQTAIAQDNADVLARQLAETTAKFDAGLLTRTDVAQSQARLSLAKAQLATAQSALAQARAAYQAVVGQSPGELAPAPPIEPLLPANVDAAFDLADRDNPQLRQATYAEAASGARLAEAKAQTRPTVSVSGQYGYVGVQQGLSASGISGSANVMESEIGASVTANVNIPIFTGGLTSSQIRQAAELDTVSRIGIETARRQVLQTVAQAWNQLLGARANVAADEVQTQSDTVAFDGVRQEQKVGLRTVLDVLNAENELAQSRLALVGARHDEYVAAAAVLAATGALDAAALVPGTPRYDPKAHFERARHAVGWVPWEGAVGALDRLGSPRSPPSPTPSDAPEVVSTGAP
jgi:outer membrane protein